MSIEKRVEWIRKKVIEYKKDGIILNLGFDVESGVVAHLANLALPGKVIIVWAGTQTPNKRNFLRNAKSSGVWQSWVNIDFGLEFLKLQRKTFELVNPYKDRESMEKYFYKHEVDVNKNYKEHPKINYIMGDMKERWRANVVASHASLNNYLILSSLNKSKYITGLFTKGGEDFGNIAPIIDLTRTEVLSLAKELNLNPVVINTEPTRGHFNEQTDLEDLGISYESLDNFLLKKSLKNKELIENLILKAKFEQKNLIKLDKFKEID